nr:PI-PLC X domain-containing protein 3-like [Biomphalaria glabrata]
MSSLENAEWMTLLKSTSLIDIPLTDLAIPRTHNSGTFALDSNGCVVPGASTEIENLANNPLIGQMAKGIIQRWAVCQSLDFSHQLELGIRYFDLRVATKPDCQEIFCVHQLYGSKVTDLTDAVDKYLKAHPHEVVLIDFNHFYCFEAEHHIQLATLLLSVFGTKICPNCDLQSLTLRRMWEDKKQVIIFYQSPEVEMFPEFFLSDTIISPWPNTPDKELCKQYLNQKLTQKHKKFVVCQGVLTPTLATIMAGLFGSLENWTKPWITDFTTWIRVSDPCQHHLNIVITDFVHNSEFIQTVIDLNKCKVKAELH